MRYEIDPGTGLARVPEGHFWRVMRRGSRRYPYEVKLYRHAPTWWNKNRCVTVPGAEDIFEGSADLRDATLTALAKLADLEEVTARARIEQETLVGDYPPKVHRPGR